MAYLAVDKDGTECIFSKLPIRRTTNEYGEKIQKPSCKWGYIGIISDEQQYVELPQGSIKKLIGKELTWKDKPYLFNTISNNENKSVLK